jgi:hypothetical protein
VASVMDKVAKRMVVEVIDLARIVLASGDKADM